MTSQLFLLFRSQVVSNSSRPHGQQPARLPSPSPGPCPSSRPLNRCTLLLNFSSLSQGMKIAALSRGDWEDCRRPVRQSYTAWHTGVPGTQEASAAVLHCLAHRSAWHTAGTRLQLQSQFFPPPPQRSLGSSPKWKPTNLDSEDSHSRPRTAPEANAEEPNRCKSLRVKLSHVSGNY